METVGNNGGNLQHRALFMDRIRDDIVRLSQSIFKAFPLDDSLQARNIDY